MQTLFRSLLAALCLWLLIFSPSPLFAQTAVTTFQNYHVQFLDNNGKPVVAGCVFTYAAGTSTPQATYSDSAGSIQNANPITLDAGGFADIWLIGSAYKITLKSFGGTACALGSQIWSKDNITTANLVYAAKTNANNVFTANNTFSGSSTTFNGTSVSFPPAVWTIPNPFVATYALGTAPVGGSHYLPLDFEQTWSGNASGNSDVIGWHFGNTVSGAGNLTFSAGGRFNNLFTGSGTLSDRFIGGLSEATHNGTGTLQNMYGLQVRLGVLNTGGGTAVSGNMISFIDVPPAWSGAGTFPNYYGFWAADPGLASTNPGHVTNTLFRFGCPEITMIATNITACYYSAVTSGATKWNLYIDGTASNWVRAVTGFGNFPTAGDQVDIGGILRQQGVTLNSLDSYGQMIFNSTGGFTSGARRFMVTNAVNGNSFAIIRSVSASADPALNATTGAVSSGTADLTISNAGLVSVPNGLTSASQITSTLATGTAPFSITSTTPVSNLNASLTAYSAAGTQQTNTHAVYGSCTLGTDCAVTLTGSAAFSSTGSYQCMASDASGIFAVRSNQTAANAVTFTGNGTDVIRYACIGN